MSHLPNSIDFIGKATIRPKRVLVGFTKVTILRALVFAPSDNYQIKYLPVALAAKLTASIHRLFNSKNQIPKKRKYLADQVNISPPQGLGRGGGGVNLVLSGSLGFQFNSIIRYSEEIHT